MNETVPKKLVSRNFAIVLGIICIVLTALIAYFTVIGISAQNSYNNLQNQNNELQMWLIGNETLLNVQVYNTNLQNQVENLTQILSLNESTPEFRGYSMEWDTGGEHSVWVGSTYPPIPYAGYIEVQVGSTDNNSYVRMTWSSYGISYNNQIGVGNGGTAVFPILPTTNPHVYVGTTDNNGATFAITITYYY